MQSALDKLTAQTDKLKIQNRKKKKEKKEELHVDDLVVDNQKVLVNGKKFP